MASENGPITIAMSQRDDLASWNGSFCRCSMAMAHIRRPATLIRRLSDDPKFFAQLIALIFRSKDEQASDTESPFAPFPVAPRPIPCLAPARPLSGK